MLRNRFTKFGFLLLLSAVTTVSIAGPPPGKGGGKDGGDGGDDGGNGSPPPVTYMINWIDDFGVREANNAGDLIGHIPSLQTTRGLIYGGEQYVVDAFFIGLDATPRVLFGLSNRLDDGSLYLCGTCDTVDGIRGWRMKVSPSTNGLEPASFSLLQPADGDEISALKSINIRGESVGYSYIKTGDSATEVFTTLYQSDLETLEVSTSGTRTHFITDLGEVIGQFELGDGTTKIGRWSPGNSLQILLSTATLSADDLGLLSVSDIGTFLVDMYEEHTTRKNSYWVTTTYLYDEGLTYLTDDTASPERYADVNSFGDLVSSYYQSGKGSTSGRYINEVYFASLDVIEELDNMIDDANELEDTDRWFAAGPIADLITDSGLVVGSADSGATFVLVPVSP